MEIEVSRLSENCLCIAQFHSDEDQAILVTPAQARELAVALQSLLNDSNLVSVILPNRGPRS